MSDKVVALVDRRPSHSECYGCNRLGIKPCLCSLTAELQRMDIVDLSIEPDTPTVAHPPRVMAKESPVAWPNKYSDIGVTPHPFSKYKRSRVVSYTMWEVGVRKPVTRSLDSEFRDCVDSVKRLKLDTVQTKITDYM